LEDRPLEAVATIIVATLAKECVERSGPWFAAKNPDRRQFQGLAAVFHGRV
jgi:hypothetical protein